mgnify:CR=1 FL=1
MQEFVKTYDIYRVNDGEMYWLTRCDAGSANEALREFYREKFGRDPRAEDITDENGLFGVEFDCATVYTSDAEFYQAQLFQ